MTIEEKARAYDEALNWMRELYPGLHGATKEDAEHYFPELRESEDERMMRMIGLALTDVPEERFTSLGTTLKDCLAYLEKQKDHFRIVTKMVEQKPAENGVDVIKTSALLAADRLASAEMTGRLKERSEILENPEKYGLYKPAEWSEEDEKMLKSVLWVLESYVSKDECGESPALTATYPTYFKEIAWLKSLRPQPHWKPSKVQMKAMEFVIKDYREDGCIATANYLQEILEQIKKL